MGDIKIYTPQEAANMLKVTKPTITRWIRQGKMEASMVGGGKSIRITEEAIRKFMENTKIENETN